MQWTDWNSASDAENGNDFEILEDHVKFFGWVLSYLVFKKTHRQSGTHENSDFRVCSDPTHIEARNVSDKISWFGTQTVLIYDTTPKPAPERNWAYGISRNSGYSLTKL